MEGVTLTMTLSVLPVSRPHSMGRLACYRQSRRDGRNAITLKNIYSLDFHINSYGGCIVDDD